MSDKQNTGVPFTSDDESEQAVWNTLGQLQRETPSARLRQTFYDELDRVGGSWLQRFRDWLGFSNNVGWITATACLGFGLAMGLIVQNSPSSDGTVLAELEQQVATLNRNLILDRLGSTSASKRLRGVIDAVEMVESDAVVAQALLARAVEDRVYSVRSAAIDALGPQLDSPVVGDELMRSLEATTDSPLVQFALVDLVMRHGTIEQLQRLLQLADQGRLHPDLVQHVKNSVWREQA